MGEITYLLEEMKNMPDGDDTPFENAPSHFDPLDDNPSNSNSNSNMPATLEELSDLMGKPYLSNLRIQHFSSKKFKLKREYFKKSFYLS